MELILTCWTHMSAPDRDDVNALVHQFYEDSGECRACSIDPERHSRAVYIIGVNTLIQKFEEWLIVSPVLSNLSYNDDVKYRTRIPWTNRCGWNSKRYLTSCAHHLLTDNSSPPQRPKCTSWQL